MNITDEAVEAAAKVIVRTVVCRSWESLLPSRQDWYRVQARAALKAAAPHMLAAAWDEGYTTGNAHNGRRDVNPYRRPLKLPPGSISGDGDSV